MTLVDIEQNKEYQIHKINTDDQMLRERLVAFGLCNGTKTSLLEKSIDKSTIVVMANNTRIALRTTEAREISVKELA